jgi:hypothetical protein
MRISYHHLAVSLSIAGILSTLLLGGNATATTAVAVDTQSATNRASSVVLATVASQESRWNDARTKIYTYTELEVEKDLKGNTSGKKIRLKQLGGSVGNVTCYVPGTATFRRGEKVLAFLRPLKTDKTCFRVVGMAQGKYSVLKDGTAVRRLNGLHVVGADPDRVRQDSRVPVDTLIEKVRATLAAAPRQKKVGREGSAK